MGDVHPSLLLDPRHAELAARPYPWPPADHRPEPQSDFPAVRDRVNACPDRGGVLPISMQDDCGCRGRELSECRAGKGKVAGRVTLRECLACQAINPGETP